MDRTQRPRLEPVGRSLERGQLLPKCRELPPSLKIKVPENKVNDI